jgi:hypothetical protein
LVYVRTAEGNDALAWVDKLGSPVTESPLAILKAAECDPETPAVPRHDNHHDLVRQGIERIASEEKSVGGQLGRPSGARFRTYERLKRYADAVRGTLFDFPELRRAIEDIYNYPLRQAAVDILNRQLRSGISDADLAQRVIELRMEEAVEICKLRLFLKLVAQVDRAKDLEPLPDIDFNIRPGNTLAGFLSIDEIRRAAERDAAGQGRPVYSEIAEDIRRNGEDAEIVDRAFRKFHEMQSDLGMDAREFAVAKQDRKRSRGGGAKYLPGSDEVAYNAGS